jgi:hypothetical protein
MAPTDRSVQPGLVASAVWEPTVGAAHSDVENKIECCVFDNKETGSKCWEGVHAARKLHVR